MAICLPDEGMGTRALAREAVIRPLTDRPINEVFTQIEIIDIDEDLVLGKVC